MRGMAHWRLRSRTLELGRRTLVMGVVNITPDSFSDGGLFLASEKAIDHALRLIGEGADIVDLGAESTRPGSRAGGTSANLQPAVSAEEEQERLLPVLEGILKILPHAVVSVDTYKAETARAGLRAGAEIVNDVSGFSGTRDRSMCARSFTREWCCRTRAGDLMEWRAQPQLEPDVLMATVREGLAASLAAAERAGIPIRIRRARPRLRIRQTLRRKLRASRASGGVARFGPSLARRFEPEVIPWPHTGASLRR